MKTFTVVAFGALNRDSYDIFAEHLNREAAKHGLQVTLRTAKPYPNAESVSMPMRPLRAEALKSDDKRQELYTAVTNDAKEIGAMEADICCMPCMSMVGFHDGIEKTLGKPITRLSHVLTNAYKDINKVGVLHMRPATKRIEEIFGTRAVVPSTEDTKNLLSAEEQIKSTGNAKAIISVMQMITKKWQEEGLAHVLFARADAPKAEKHIEMQDTDIRSIFGVLAKDIVNSLVEINTQ